MAGKGFTNLYRQGEQTHLRIKRQAMAFIG